jgi:hypothetical protein
MKSFKQGNWNGKQNVCPICETTKEGEVTLIAIDGTNTKESPLNFQAMQVHVDCLELFYNKKLKLIYQEVKNGI